MRTRLYITSLGLSACLMACAGGAKAPDLRNGTDPIAATSNASTQSQAEITSPVPVRTATQNMTYRVGPYALNDHQKAGDMLDQPAGLHIQLDDAVWFTGFSIRIEDEHGKQLPRALLHSATLINHSDHSSQCADRQAGAIIAAVSPAHTEIALPAGHGYAISASDQLEAQVVLQNLSDTRYETVFVSITLHAESMQSGSVSHDVTPYHIGSVPCTHDTIAVEPGAYHQHKVKTALPQSGHIVAAYGLLQQHGLGMSLTQEDTATEAIWKAESELDEKRNIRALDHYSNPEGVAVQSGTPLTLTVSYQNFSEQWLDYASASAIVYLAPSEDPSLHSAAKPYLQKSTVAASSVQSALLQ